MYETGAKVRIHVVIKSLLNALSESQLLTNVCSPGKSTGLVTNTRVTHATPAALYAHSASRYWEDDSKIPSSARNLCKDIARQLVEDSPGNKINVGWSY